LATALSREGLEQGLDRVDDWIWTRTRPNHRSCSPLYC